MTYKQKSQKRTIVGLIISILALTMFTIGMSFAYFTSTKSLASDTMKFGHLNLGGTNVTLAAGDTVAHSGTIAASEDNLLPGCEVTLGGTLTLDSTIKAFVRVGLTVECDSTNAFDDESADYSIATNQVVVEEANWNTTANMAQVVYNKIFAVLSNAEKANKVSGGAWLSASDGYIYLNKAVASSDLTDGALLTFTDKILFEANAFGNAWKDMNIKVSLSADAIQAEHLAGVDASKTIIASGEPTSSQMLLSAFQTATTAVWGEANGDGYIESSNVTPETPEEPEDTNYLTFSSDEVFYVYLDSGLNYEGTLEYSTDAVTWSQCEKWNPYSSTTSGDTKVIYLRGTDNTILSGPEVYDNRCFIFYGFDDEYEEMDSNSDNAPEIYCSGNIETLLDYETVANGGHPTMGESCFESLFLYCKTLVSAPELPATTLVYRCYKYMFDQCISLRIAPKLAATTLADECCQGMFSSCESLQISKNSGDAEHLIFTLPSVSGLNSPVSGMFSGTKEGGYTSDPEGFESTYYWVE